MVVPVVGDAVEESRFMIDALAVTAMEATREDEQAAWDRICHHFDVEAKSIDAALLTADDLAREEVDARTRIEREQVQARNQLSMVIELMRHGCDAAHESHVAGASPMSLIRPPPPEVVDESWRNLPTLISVDHGAFRPQEYTLSALETQLVAINDETGTMHAVAAQRLERQERSAREALERREDSVRRQHATYFQRTREGLQQIQDHMEDEFRQIVMARMPVELRWAYTCFPTLTAEAHDRELIALQEACNAKRLFLQFSAFAVLSVLRKECSDGYAALVVKRDDERRRTMWNGRMDNHGRSRWSCWLRWLMRRRNVAKQRLAADVRAAASQARTLRRYCCKWRDNRIVAKHLLQQRAMIHEAILGSLALMGREDEERHRNSLVADELILRQRFEDEHLAERDSVKQLEKQQQAAILEINSEATHRLLILSRWYGVVRRKQLSAKCEWLRATTESRVMGYFLAKWQSAPPLLRAIRPIRRQVFRALVLQKLYESNSLCEEALRAAQCLREELERHILECVYQEATAQLCCEVQMARLQRMGERNQMIHRAGVFERWSSAVELQQPRRMAVLHLRHRNQMGHLLSRFSLWSQRAKEWLRPRQALERSNCIAHLLLLVEAEEAVDALSIEFQRERFVIRVTALRRRSLRIPLDTSRLVSAMVQSSTAQFAWRAIRMWSWSVSRRRQRAFAVTELLPALHRRVVSQLGASYFASWLEYCMTSVVLRETHKSLARLPQDESERRCRIEQDERAVRDALLHDSATGRQALRRNGRTEKTARLSASVERSHVARRFAEWSAVAQRTVAYRESKLRSLTTIRTVGLMKGAFRRWKRWTNWLRVSDKLLYIQQEAESALRQKYFFRFAPHALRIAKVSKAKSSLDRAKEAAKILAVPSLDTAVGTRLLPPIRRADMSSGNV